MTLPQFLDQPWLVVAAILTLILGAGRITRLVTWDDYPPTIAIRTWWVAKVTKDNGWAKLATCLWCFAPWVTAVGLAWFLLALLFGITWLQIAWWIVFGWLGISYLVSMVVRRDEPES